MNFEQMAHSIYEKKITGIYLIDSKEEYLSDHIRKALEDSLNFPAFNFISLDGNISFDSLKTAYSTVSVMDDRKIVIWNDVDLSKGAISKFKAIEELAKQCDNFPENAVLVIFSKDELYKGSFYKKILKYHNIVTIDRLNLQQMKRFIIKLVQRNGKKITNNMVTEIITRFSYLSNISEIKLYDVYNTVNKIILNSRDVIISKEDVVNQLDRIIDANIFNFTDSLLKREIKEALKYFNIIYPKRESEDKIFNMLLSTVRNMLALKSVENRLSNYNYCMKVVGVNRFVFSKLLQFKDNFTTQEIADIVKHMYKMEIERKSGHFHFRQSMEILILKFRK